MGWGWQAKAVRGRLTKLGPAVPPRVLHSLRASVSARVDVAMALLREIDADTEPCDRHFDASGITLPIPPAALFATQDGADMNMAELQEAAHQAALACWRVADADALVQMLTLPPVREEATRAFERAVARGAFGEQAIVMVLERRRTQRMRMEGEQGWGRGADGAVEGNGDEEEFPCILGLAETLALSEDVRVREFVGTLYAVMFKVYGDQGYRERMLRGLVGRASSSSAGSPEGELGLDILAFLVRGMGAAAAAAAAAAEREFCSQAPKLTVYWVLGFGFWVQVQEEGVGRPVLALMREAIELAVSDRGAMWQKLRAKEEEVVAAVRRQEEEVARLSKEKAVLQQKVVDAESHVARLKVGGGGGRLGWDGGGVGSGDGGWEAERVEEWGWRGMGEGRGSCGWRARRIFGVRRRGWRR